MMMMNINDNRRAMSGGRSTAPRISNHKTTIKTTGVVPVTVPTYYLVSAAAADRVLATRFNLNTESPSAIGFDIEWKPRDALDKGDHPIALLQLYDGSAAYLFHLAHFSYMPDRLREVLAHPGMIKVGIGARQDAKKMSAELGVVVEPVVELQDLAHRLGINGPYGLKSLMHSACGLHVVKSKDTARSNWEQRLTPEQLHYAAQDAFLGWTLLANMYRQYANGQDLQSFLSQRKKVARVLEVQFADLPVQTRREAIVTLGTAHCSLASLSATALKSLDALRFQIPLHQLNTLTVKGMRNVLKQQRLSVQGSKQTLLRRIKDCMIGKVSDITIFSGAPYVETGYAKLKFSVDLRNEKGGVLNDC